MVARICRFQFVGIAGIAFVLGFTGVKTAGPWCFNCNDVVHPAICQFVVQCGEHESCSTKKVINQNGGEFYTSSCKDAAICHGKTRSISRVEVCDDCCNGTLCNEAGCNSKPLRPDKRLYCLNCNFVKQPQFCDQVELCSPDEKCSLTLERRINFEYYNLGCRPERSCPSPNATTTKGKSICCDTDICNSNDLGQDPATYTTTPIPTTRIPAQPRVSFNESNLMYNVTHAPNEAMNLLCHVTGGPVPTVTWLYNNGTSTVSVTPNFIKSQPNGDSVLSIPSPTKTDSGKYTCKAVNILGSYAKEIDVTVLVPPEIKGSLNNSKVAKYQEDIIFDCNVTADNGTTVSWDVPIGVSSFAIFPNNSLKIYNVHSENAGDYLCTAENADGKTVKSFSVSVNDNSSQTPTPCSCPTLPPSTCPTVTQSNCPTVNCPKVTVTPCASQPTTLTNKGASTTTTFNVPLINTPVVTSTMTTTTDSPTTQSTVSSGFTSNSAQVHTLPTFPGNGHFTMQTPSFSMTTSTNINIKDQFQSQKRYLNIMQCPSTFGTNDHVTWERLVNNFDHTNPVYTDNGYGVLTISNQVSILTTGVYECRIGNKPIAQFVIYEALPDTVKCNDVFGKFTNTVGVVIRAKCGVCPKSQAVTTASFKITDGICTSANAAGHIPAYGGDVTYLIKSPTEVILLEENKGDILIH